MNKLSLLIVFISLSFFCSCTSKEDKVKKVVNQFLIVMNDQTKSLDRELITDNFYSFIENKNYYKNQKWELNASPIDDSTYTVEANGFTYNGFGQRIEIVQVFALTNVYGGWKIFNSFNFVVDEFDIEIIDKEWDFYWDRDKYEIINTLKNKLELKVIESGISRYDSNYKEGKLRIINNSEFDIQSINILIEHYDNQGFSVNTDNIYCIDIIRKNGYRDINWITGDCSNCYKQKFKILFEKESL